MDNYIENYMENENIDNDFMENEFAEDQIDLFEKKYTYIILEFYYDLKDRIPYFITKMQFFNLLNIITSAKFTLCVQNKKTINAQCLTLFEEKYYDEIKNLLYVINNFLSCNFKNCCIDYNDWLEFCYTFT